MRELIIEAIKKHADAWIKANQSTFNSWLK